MLGFQKMNGGLMPWNVGFQKRKNRFFMQFAVLSDNGIKLAKNRPDALDIFSPESPAFITQMR